MKANLTKFCAVVLLAAQTIVLAQKTEVSVQKGKVIAETATASVTVDAGRKTVLTPDKKPTVTVDNPLVDDALKLYKLIEAEKEQSDLKIDSVSIMVGKADKDEGAVALYFEFPNYSSETTDVFRIPQMAIFEDFKVYDLKGNLCQVDVKLLNESSASYSIHFSEKVKPGEHFKMIGVANPDEMPLIPGGVPSYSKEGSLWHFRTALNSRNCLNYFRFILPESAILVDCNREILATDTIDGRVAVTIRNYTGEYADGWCMISLLWPDEDGTTIADIPDKYHGLRNKQDEKNSETFKQGMDKARAGIKYEDQSTPLAALITDYGSAVLKDTELYAKVKYKHLSPDQIQKRVENAKYWANIVDVLSIPSWPENPGNGYVHPIYLSRKGSMICEHVAPIVFWGGKWYVHDTKQHFGAENKFEKPTVQEIAAAEAKGYLTNWEVAGPYIQRDKKASELFDIPFGPELPDADVPWHPVSIEPYEQHPAHVNLNESLLHFEQAVTYLRTEIKSDREKESRLEIYTDDGVKAWLNGKLIHENNNSRGIPEEPDTVAVTLKKGTNNLMLKVTEDIWGSRAIVRLQD
ncbi:MAG: hypothetical protein H8D56_01595 [Planctomycetes bacterium]|nr:hypothetical protein [Planctomycetota bacterium]MBL7143039.1 hypothetical protein [Phycisphaerae bacterium]